MILKHGQIWIDTRTPGYAYKVTRLDHEGYDFMSCYVDVLYHNPNGTLTIVDSDRFLITYMKDYSNWHQLFSDLSPCN